MVDFSNIKNIEIPEGNVKSISSGGIVLWQSSKVPSEYQEVEYIGNSGTQYLNTGFNPNFSNGFTIEIEYTPTDLSNRGCLLSNYQANNHISIELASGTANQRVYINSGAIDYNVSGTTLNKNKGIVSYSNGTVTNKINENVGTRSGTFTGITGQPLYMFVDYNKRFSTFTNYLKIYSCKIYDGNTLVRDFIPCYRKNDNVIGMYDIVGDQFYTNAGTGTFTKGGNV